MDQQSQVFLYVFNLIEKFFMVAIFQNGLSWIANQILTFQSGALLPYSFKGLLSKTKSWFIGNS
jgi:hypothetical protein